MKEKAKGIFKDVMNEEINNLKDDLVLLPIVSLIVNVIVILKVNILVHKLIIELNALYHEHSREECFEPSFWS